MRVKLIILLSLICLGIQAQTSILALSDYSNARMEGFGNVGVVAPVDYGFAAFKENPALLSHFSGQFGGVFSNDLSYGTGVGTIGFVVSPGKRHIVGGGVRTFGNYQRVSLGDADNQKTSKEDFILNLVYAFKLSEKIRIGASINYLDYFVRRTIYYQGHILPDFKKEGSAEGETLYFGLGVEYVEKFTLNDGSIIYLSVGSSVNHIGPRIRYIQQHKSVEPEMIDLPTIFRIGCIGDPEFRLSEKTRLHLIMAYQYERHLVELQKPDHFQRGIHKYGLEIRVDFSEKFYLAFRSGGVEDEIVYNKFMYSPWGFGLKIWKIYIDFAYANVTTFDGTVANTELGISFKSGLNYE